MPHTRMVGAHELAYRRRHPREPVSMQIRSPRGGCKSVRETDPELAQALEVLVDPVTQGHPESPLRWTCKSTTKLAAELQ
jgi:hypothetical protein